MLYLIFLDFALLQILHKNIFPLYVYLQKKIKLLYLMSMYSSKEMEEIGEDLGKILIESKYPKIYLCLFISGTVLVSSYILYSVV